jgi:pimeloyl-ACP methyl ester carboxylesterase
MKLAALSQDQAIEHFDIAGTTIAVRLAGDAAKPALLLIHGFPSSSRSFRSVMPALAEVAYVVAPDLPGFGASAPLEVASFSGFADVLRGLLDHLGIGSFHLYLHDYGAAVGLHLATRQPERIRSLIIQNANAHEAGIGGQWTDTIEYWRHPTPDSERRATAHLTPEGTRDQYVGGVPPDVAARVDPGCWEEDWRVMSMPGRVEMQRDLVRDYGNHVDRFDEIAAYLRDRQPPALLIWGRHDIFFDIEETIAWMKALPRMEAHILDGPHFLLETHAHECAALMTRFVTRVQDRLTSTR